MADIQWKSTNLNALVMPPNIQQALDGVGNIAQNITKLARDLQAALKAAKVLLTDIASPLLTAIIFLIDQLLEFIQNLKNSGIYWIFIYPSEYSNTKFIKYTDFLPGFDSSVKNGFYTLDTETNIKIFSDSLNDVKDIDKPPTNDTFVAGGLFLFIGFGSKAAFNYLEIIKKMKSILDLLGTIFNVQDINNYRNKLDKIINDLHAAEAAAANRGTLSNITNQKSKLPDWKAQKLTRDVIPVLGDFLSTAEGFLNGIKSSLKDQQAALDLLVKFIDTKIKQIEELTKSINDLKNLIKGLKSLGGGQVWMLPVEAQAGGINKLKNALRDTNLANRPPKDLQFTASICFIADGVSLSLLFNLFGISTNFSLTEGFETDTREKFMSVGTGVDSAKEKIKSL